MVCPASDTTDFVFISICFCNVIVLDLVLHACPKLDFYFYF